MDGSSAAGNPNAASSGSLPAHAGGAGSASEHDQQSRESVGLSGSQKHPPLAETPELQDLIRTSHQQHSPPADPNPEQPEPEHTSPCELGLLSAPQKPEESGLAENPPPPDDPPKPEPTKPHRLNRDQKKQSSSGLGPEHGPGRTQYYQNLRVVDLDAEEDSPPSSEDLPEGTEELQVQQSGDEQNHQDPFLEKLAFSHSPHRDPNTQQVLSTDQQNLLSPTTHPLTLAPPAPPQVCPPPPDSSGEPRLCGYLQKQGGPLRAWKQRWFTYEEKKNQLFYYRTPQDVMPLGRVELSGATFTYPLKAEKGTFHIQTPERTFILKAVTQDLMLYWLQQLQAKRWRHRQTNPETTSNTADDFLPTLKSPLGLVGEAAASASMPWTPLANMSIKHPLIEIQNSVHSLRKRTSQDLSQSMFYSDTMPWTHREPKGTSSAGTPTKTPPPPLPLACPADQASSSCSRASPSPMEMWSGGAKTRSSSTMPLLRRNMTSTSSDRTSRLQQEKEMLMEEVKAQKELVWILHKALEAAQLEKRTCAEFLAEQDEQERLELLRHRERQAANLRGRLEDAKMEAETLRRSLADRDAQVGELQDNIRRLTEKNNAKQQVIVKLSDQVTSSLSDARQSSSSSAQALDPQSFKQLQQKIENLKDDIEAYKIQNKFLNSEIYQLTKLWRKSSEQEKSLMVKCAYLEAGNCQMESRYLGVLRKLQETKSLDPGQREAVQKMVEDALRGELNGVIELSSDTNHDKYGFKIIPDYEVEDMKLLAKIQALEIRSHNLLHQEGVEHPLLNRWAQYLAGRSDDDLCASPELKVLLRGGVPREYRQRVWRWVVRARTKTIRESHPQRYEQLCEKSRTSPHSVSRQIQLDLHRTLTTNQLFSSPSSPAIQQLRRILLAFSWQNPAIGYCQGLNRLAAIALLVLQSEEDAFWCLVAVVETIMPQDYYTKNLVASQADQRVLKDFLLEKLPRLSAHFEGHNIDVSLITFNWFLVVFVESLPSDILLPVWDAFLYEGTKVIFRYALALFKYKEDDILKIHDGVEIYQYLRFFTKTISDSRKLMSIAFNDMNPFPGRLLRNRRAQHLERLQGELCELEEQQKEFVVENTERKDKELDMTASEDDD